MDAPNKGGVEALEVKLFLKEGHYKLAFAVVCIRSLRIPAAVVAGGFPFVELLKWTIARLAG